MTDSSNFKFTNSQFIFLVLGYSIIINILKLPVIMASFALQDAWISMLIAGIYPISLLFFYFPVYKKNPDKNIFQINREYLGKTFGTLFNIIFYLYILSYSITQVAGFSMIFADTLFWYYNSTKVLLLLLFIAFLGLFYKFKAMVKFTQFSLTIVFVMFFIILFGFFRGSISNITPILQIEPKYILKGAYYGSYAYSGFEIFLIYIPFLKKPKDYKKISISISLVLIIFFTYLVFMNLFFLGPDVITVFYYPLLNILSSVKIPFLNNFVFVFLSSWVFHCIRNTTFSIYNLTYCLNTKRNLDTVNPFKSIVICIILFFGAYIVNDILTITFFIDKLLVPLTTFVLFNVFILFLLSKRRKRNE
ncbi:spore germination protein [Clostridium sp. LY3-2]|uniref:GerAB/ArcD/ProY family transporter n=1 Tax=Clostridium sp. LY3-2 TaxID=2942482 RepID=UPI002152AFCD|nr:spore germination protein [Clostridium sp. LY3-2]MCR6513463.1 spore germination protein [Clostridium sp. LY3-2]